MSKDSRLRGNDGLLHRGKDDAFLMSKDPRFRKDDRKKAWMAVV